jgi:hypothetical protein
MIWRCRAENIKQLTFRDVAMPEDASNQEVYDWTKEHPTDFVKKEMYNIFVAALRYPTTKELLGLSQPTQVLQLPHGGIVYDVQGQNVCLGNCLTESVDPNDIRQLIFFPDGSLRYSWQYEGACIL